jgi:hypothetical protein
MSVRVLRRKGGQYQTLQRFVEIGEIFKLSQYAFRTPISVGLWSKLPRWRCSSGLRRLVYMMSQRCQIPDHNHPHRRENLKCHKITENPCLWNTGSMKNTKVSITKKVQPFQTSLENLPKEYTNWLPVRTQLKWPDRSVALCTTSRSSFL